jgi:hypothetical protein
MTQPTDPLHEPLRLLRETRLPTGFEERLAERLARAQREPPAIPRRSGGRRRALLLLAAIALPAAAYASGAWLLEHRRASITRVSDKHREAKALPNVNSKTSALPASENPPLAAVQEHSASEQPAHSRPSAHLAPTTPKSRTSQATQHSNAAPSRAAQESKRSDSTSAVAAESEAPSGGDAPRETPAKIEALELSVPRGEEANDSAHQPTSDTLRLRESSVPSTSRSSANREYSGAQRERASERRGSDAAQQARERVQARERKGQ